MILVANGSELSYRMDGRVALAYPFHGGVETVTIEGGYFEASVMGAVVVLD